MPWILLFVAILLEVAVPIFYVCSAASGDARAEGARPLGYLRHLVRRRHGARDDDRHRLFPRADHCVQNGLHRPRHHRRDRALTRCAAEQLTASPIRANMPAWMEFSVR